MYQYVCVFWSMWVNMRWILLWSAGFLVFNPYLCSIKAPRSCAAYDRKISLFKRLCSIHYWSHRIFFMPMTCLHFCESIFIIYFWNNEVWMYHTDINVENEWIGLKSAEQNLFAVSPSSILLKKYVSRKPINLTIYICIH